MEYTKNPIAWAFALLYASFFMGLAAALIQLAVAVWTFASFTGAFGGMVIIALAALAAIAGFQSAKKFITEGSQWPFPFDLN